MSKLWQKNYSLDAAIEKFTVGEDYLLDRNLVVADCVASIAHARMLASIKILSEKEFVLLREELLDIIERFGKDEFTISLEDEDCHTAIENHLVSKIGETGKKIHTGRSRNDQVIAALRLYGRDFLLAYADQAIDLVLELCAFAKKHEFVPMPGRTHMQIAMPSSVGLWAGAFAEEITDILVLMESTYRLNNMCPLGSAASYGVPLPLNREMVAESLGFERLQNNVLYVNNSRGKIESIILSIVEQVCLTLSKMAQDLILFSMPEFQYFSIPAELCSGSSIMPQKRNPCGLELIRAKTASVTAAADAVKNIIKSLPTGYNRDFQETKGHFIRGVVTGIQCLRIMTLTIRKLGVNEDNLRKGFINEIYSTDRALELVNEGMPFRDAYREVGLQLDAQKDRDPVEAIRKKTHSGAPGNLMIEKTTKEIDAYRKKVEAYRRTIENALNALCGGRPALFYEIV